MRGDGHLGVPVAVVNDAGVGSLQVHPQAPRAGVEDVEEHLTPRLVEHPDVDGTLHAVGGAIQPEEPAKKAHDDAPHATQRPEFLTADVVRSTPAPLWLACKLIGSPW